MESWEDESIQSIWSVAAAVVERSQEKTRCLLLLEVLGETVFVSWRGMYKVGRGFITRRSD
jgi:hypothetical protein